MTKLVLLRNDEWHLFHDRQRVLSVTVPYEEFEDKRTILETLEDFRVNTNKVDISE